MKIVIAPNSFKDAISSIDLAETLQSGLAGIQPEADWVSLPLSDGGERFAECVAKSLGLPLHSVEVLDPLFRQIQAPICKVPSERIPGEALEKLQLGELPPQGFLAVIGMASASGLEKLKQEERNPWNTSSVGTGMLLQACATMGASAILLGIGGSATNDCGVGALEALGTRFYDRDLQPVRNLTPARLERVNTLGSTSHVRLDFPPVRIACDVDNPLLGPEGASTVYGPQKGLKTEDLPRMERLMRKTAGRLLGLFGIPVSQWPELMQQPGTGAAGGIGFALQHALADVRLIAGFESLSSLLGWEKAIRAADVILTGEGRLDPSSLAGKGPAAILQMTSSGQKTLVLAGSVETATAEELKRNFPGAEVVQITPEGTPLAEALASTPENAVRSAKDWLGKLS